MRTDDLLSPRGPSLLDKIIAASLRNKALVLIGVFLVAALGFRSAQQLPIDAVPDVTNVQVQILTDSPGLSPLEVERFVTWPVETSMAGLPRTEEVRSLSRFGLSVVTVVFEEGTDLWWARQVVSERLGTARESIPEGYGEPEIGPPSTGLGEVFQFEVRNAPGADHSLMDLRDVLEWQIAPQLRSVPGVVEINAFGGELRTYQVEVRPSRLAAHGLVLADVFEALEHNNLTVGGGYLERGREQMLVRGTALLGSLEDVEDVVVATTEEGTPITVEALGEVRFAPLIRQGAVTRDGRGEAVIGIAMMGFGENARVVSEDLADSLTEIEPSLPEGVEVDVFYNRTDLVERTIRTVETNLLEGGLLVIAVLLLMLGNVRGGLIVAVAIPLSMLCAFIGMLLAGLSGNLMSLGAIDFGLIVDGSVVMIENIVRVVGERRRKGETVDDGTILEASREVARPVTFAVGIIMLVYLPILALTGIEGKMFRPMALTVVFALAGSLVLALTAMPVLASVFLKQAEEKDTWLVRLAHRVYRPALDMALRHPHRVGVTAAVVFAASLGLAPLLGAVFVPKLDEGSIALQIIRPPSVSLEESILQAGEVERAILEAFPDEATTVISRTGRAEIATDPMGVDFSDVYVMLHPQDEWTRAQDQAGLVEEMEAELRSRVPGVNFAFSQPIELRVNELIEGVRSDVALFLYGEDLDELKRVGDQMVATLGSIEGAQDVKAEKIAGLPMLQVDVDRQAISRLGMDARDVLDAVEALGGRESGDVLVGQRRFRLQVRFPEEVRQDPDAIEAILVGSPGGPMVPLGQVATVSTDEGPLQIGRENAQRRLTIEMNVRGRDVAGFVAEAQERLEQDVDVPSGIVMDWGGSFENLQAASARLAVLVPLVLLLIFVLLQANFRSARVTLLVYANVPMAVTGGLVALFARGLPLSISAAVGFIALFGIAVMNGVVLVTCIRDLHVPGVSALEAARQGAERRLRPVLMTALVAALGFVPMAMATSAGAEVQRPLATVVIGGLVTSTLLTLLVLPALYARWMRNEEMLTQT
ncbi:MAG: CusA/CzcA family heavy metal efflux RND transporter [Myxococcota bacterium]|nr:CusA/CzcA family heavy metal efflux RND transporter [Myxococcota bacterium]